MSLDDKRFRKVLDTEILPRINKEIDEITGSNVAINIDWESFNSKESMQELEHQVFGRILDALREVSRDDIGKEALAESFKQISVKHLPSKDERSCTFEQNNLMLQTDWTDTWSIFPSVDIRQILEAGL